MRVLVLILVGLLIFLQYKLWNFNNGVVKSIKLERILRTQKLANLKMEQTNKKLAHKVYFLQHYKGSVEALARKNLGMIKHGEVYYRIVDTVTSADAGN